MVSRHDPSGDGVSEHGLASICRLIYATGMDNKLTRFYELNYRTGKIICNIHKVPESEFWTAHGRAEIQQASSYFCKPITIADRFTNEEDAKNKLIELAKNWIDSLREL